MPSRRGSRQKYVRWVAVFLVFAVVLPFVVVVLAQSDSNENDISPESAELPSEESASKPLQNKPGAVSSTPLPFVIEQEPNNKAPTIMLDGPDCLDSIDADESVSVTISANDTDGNMVTIDLSAQVGEESIDLSSFINEGREFAVPVITSATFPIPATEQAYVLLLSHATDLDGAKSEAALIIPLSC